MTFPSPERKLVDYVLVFLQPEPTERLLQQVSEVYVIADHYRPEDIVTFGSSILLIFPAIDIDGQNRKDFLKILLEKFQGEFKAVYGRKEVVHAITGASARFSWNVIFPNFEELRNRLVLMDMGEIEEIT